jgi:glucosyl-3-phosphoglycerate synthase
MTPSTLLVLSERARLASWVAFAIRLLPIEGTLRVCGMVTIRPDASLSEGALAARDWREYFQGMALAHPRIEDDVQVFVDHQPFQRVAAEAAAAGIALMIVEWGGIDDAVGGVPWAEALHLPACDVVLVSSLPDLPEAHRVLLSLRGGPNLSLGTRVSTALAGTGTITLFHARDPAASAADPQPQAVLRHVAQVRQMISTSTDVVGGIVRQAALHDIIVMGAGLMAAPGEQYASVVHDVYARTQRPIVLVRAARQEGFAFHTPVFPSDQTMSIETDRWFAQNTFHSREFADIAELVALKQRQGLRISVALPALNEEATAEAVITTIRRALVEEHPLIDELILIDSQSTDRTVEIARRCGLAVYTHQDILADTAGSYAGKGEALWKSLYVTTGDIVAWIDTDISNIHPRFVYGLLGPLLKYPRLQYVKGFYTRPIEAGGTLQAVGGGRVTELVARPLLNLFFPELSGIVQPLSGEYAGRRSALEQVPFFSGYGVETGLLIDLTELCGLEAIAQVDLEVRVHHNQPLASLSRMSFAILQVFLARMEKRYGAGFLSYANRSMKRVTQEADRFALEIAEIGDFERPPMLEIPEYVNQRTSRPG